ncbi:MAG: T9SS type A sorting domain-containing protein [Chitinophagaceae bacterium]
MKLISTLCLFLISTSCFTQNTNPSEVVITGNCWNNRMLDSSGAVISKTLPCKVGEPDTGKTARITIRCMATPLPTGNPLLWIDGKLEKLSFLKQIDPNDIEKIEIIKGAVAIALFGSEGVNGVIWITQKLRYKKIVIKDSLDKSPIAAATASFVFPKRKDTLRYVADGNGIILSNSWKELSGCEMSISAVGYKPVFHQLPVNDSVIYLERDIKTCQEVVLTPIGSTCSGCRGSYRRCSRCGSITIKKNTEIVTETKPGLPDQEFSIYPNPVQRGGSFSINFDTKVNAGSVRVLGMDGKIILNQLITEEKGIFRVSTDPRWAAGIYFVQSLYENGRVAASEKIIIQ